MNIIKTAIPDVLIFEPKVFGDARGFFFESFSQRIFEEAIGRQIKFVQDNHSKSHQGVLRGLHFQKGEHAQGKLVRCAAGEVFDVAVDIRKDSPTFSQWVGVHLSAENKRQLWIPEGFAHGFLTITDNTEILYKTTNYYSPVNEKAIIWNDKTLDIKWPFQPSVVSEKDSQAVCFLSAI